MNDCNRDVHEPCSRSFQAARAAANVDIDELMRPARERICTEQGQLWIATPRRTVSPPIGLKNRPPLASEVPSDNCCVRTGIVVSNFPLRDLTYCYFDFMLMENLAH